MESNIDNIEINILSESLSNVKADATVNSIGRQYEFSGPLAKNMSNLCGR